MHLQNVIWFSTMNRITLFHRIFDGAAYLAKDGGLSGSGNDYSLKKSFFIQRMKSWQGTTKVQTQDKGSEDRGNESGGVAGLKESSLSRAYGYEEVQAGSSEGGRKKHPRKKMKLAKLKNRPEKLVFGEDITMEGVVKT
jgi:hypothetical protein